MNFFLQGLTMGIAYDAPIGLANLFVINSALTQSRKKSLLTAIIIIIFDVSLAFACFFGIGAIMKKFEWLQLIILLVGSLIVIYMGINLLRSQTTDISAEATTEMTLFKTISSAFVVIWFNPQAIIDGSMMLGAFQVTLPSYSHPIFIAGVGIASALWFILLSIIVSKFKDKFNAKVLRIINLVCGIIIILYGGKLFWNFITLLIA
ncbi:MULTISPECIES: LysE/ArgO family amino acid transporter [Companilactobacillus]|uniref:LysE family transporter n=1 Tax=Companilactobacillus pabuli TaxID=2714036 RepID=A0A7L7KZM4_9LACO|nr:MULTISPECIES: LysE family transporter [Companilactobacillus]MDG5112142.1 LysE family transporter [Companilactobacillus pabuli]QMT85253.1 LysE family transporter [Companilactobacillus pabuli]GAQ02282.1 L-lysine permease [Companilactobacillus farciminis]